MLNVTISASGSISLVAAALMEGVADRWDSVGIFLGIPYLVIEGCREEHTMEERMRAMVEAWVNRRYDVEKFGQPSWRKLVEAVAHKSGGSHIRQAEMLARNHPTIIPCEANKFYWCSLLVKILVGNVWMIEVKNLLNNIIYFQYGNLTCLLIHHL